MPGLLDGGGTEGTSGCASRTFMGVGEPVDGRISSAWLERRGGFLKEEVFGSARRRRPSTEGTTFAFAGEDCKDRFLAEPAPNRPWRASPERPERPRRTPRTLRTPDIDQAVGRRLPTRRGELLRSAGAGQGAYVKVRPVSW